MCLTKTKLKALYLIISITLTIMKDPKKQQWKRNTAIKWAISHRIGEGYIR